jgi:hypothetical protein
VQLVRHFGVDITAVCNTKNVETVRSLGANRVIDYTKEDFTSNGQAYDMIYDAVGKHSFRRCKGSLNPGGIYLATDGWTNVARSLLTSRTRSKRVVFPMGHYAKQDVLFLKQLIEAGNYHAVIDRGYRLEDAAEAARYVETQQKTGNVVLTVNASWPGRRRAAAALASPIIGKPDLQGSPGHGNEERCPSVDWPASRRFTRLLASSLAVGPGVIVRCAGQCRIGRGAGVSA